MRVAYQVAQFIENFSGHDKKPVMPAQAGNHPSK